MGHRSTYSRLDMLAAQGERDSGTVTPDDPSIESEVETGKRYTEADFNLVSAVEPVARPPKVPKMCEKIEKLLRRRTHLYGER